FGEFTHHGTAGWAGDQDAPACFGRAHAAWIDCVHCGCGAARCDCCHAPEFFGRPSLPGDYDRGRIAAGFLHRLGAGLVFYYLLGWAPAPLGRMDVFFSPPPQVTGFYLFDSLIDGNPELFLASLKQLVLPALTLGIFSLAPIARMTRASM